MYNNYVVSLLLYTNRDGKTGGGGIFRVVDGCM